MKQERTKRSSIPRAIEYVYDPHKPCASMDESRTMEEESVKNFSIPSEIEFNNRRSHKTDLKGSEKETFKLESRHRRKRNSGNGQPISSCESSSSFPPQRRGASLQSISSDACSEILDDLHEKHSTGIQVPECKDTRVESLPLAELAGILSAKLTDAMEKGLFSKTSQDENKKKNHAAWFIGLIESIRFLI